MGIVGTILLVAFIIVCVLLILLVLVQNEDTNGMGSAFGGGQSAAFGSHSASVLTKTTGVFAALFFILAFFLALSNKVPSDSDSMTKTAQEAGIAPAAEEKKSETGSWLDDVEDNSSSQVQATESVSATPADGETETAVETESSAE